MDHELEGKKAMAIYEKWHGKISDREGRLISAMEAEKWLLGNKKSHNLMLKEEIEFERQRVKEESETQLMGEKKRKRGK